MRTFPGGATRDDATGKPQYVGYLCPKVLQRFGQYMLKHQTQADGQLRSSDNWKNGMPYRDYLESLFRHFIELLLLHDKWALPPTEKPTDPQDEEELLCAILFNTQGALREILKDPLTPEGNAHD